MLKWKMILFLTLFMVASAEAVTMNGSIINLTTENTLINITRPWTFTNLTVGKSSFLVYDLNHTNNWGYFTINYSFVARREKGSSFPYVSSMTNTLIKVTSNISTAVIVDTDGVTFNAELANISCTNLDHINYRSNTGLQTQTFGASNFTCDDDDLVIFSPLLIEQGTNNSFTLVRASLSQNLLREQCLQSAKVGADSFSFLPLAFVALIVIAIIGVLVVYGTKKDSPMDVRQSMPGLIRDTQKIAIGIGVILMVILLGAAILSSIATLYCG